MTTTTTALGRLTEAVKAQLGADNEDDFAQIMADVAATGADTGWAGFSYTSDCVEFFDQNADDIWDLLADQAEENGESIPFFMAHFGRVDMAATYDGFRNLLAWFVLEAVARHEVDTA